jgi:hypothetical protein
MIISNGCFKRAAVFFVDWVQYCTAGGFVMEGFRQTHTFNIVSYLFLKLQ